MKDVLNSEKRSRSVLLKGLLCAALIGPVLWSGEAMAGAAPSLRDRIEIGARAGRDCENVWEPVLPTPPVQPVQPVQPAPPVKNRP
jgi:hypothetical protein